jgi:hypothetical protein
VDQLVALAPVRCSYGLSMIDKCGSRLGSTSPNSVPDELRTGVPTSSAM